MKPCELAQRAQTQLEAKAVTRQSLLKSATGASGQCEIYGGGTTRFYAQLTVIDPVTGKEQGSGHRAGG